MTPHGLVWVLGGGRGGARHVFRPILPSAPRETHAFSRGPDTGNGAATYPRDASPRRERRSLRGRGCCGWLSEPARGLSGSGPRSASPCRASRRRRPASGGCRRHFVPAGRRRAARRGTRRTPSPWPCDSAHAPLTRLPPLVWRMLGVTGGRLF